MLRSPAAQTILSAHSVSRCSILPHSQNCVSSGEFALVFQERFSQTGNVLLKFKSNPAQTRTGKIACATLLQDFHR
jgi:hypothetical protein